MKDLLEIKVNRTEVFRESSENLNDLKTRKFVKESEYEEYETQYTSDVVKKGFYFPEPNVIPIETLKDIIKKAEHSGANFISIDYHCDHDEYDFYGYRIDRLTEEELAKNNIEEENKKEEERLKAIKLLEEEINKLKQK